MKIFVYPGSFDPVTNGHMDIIERASKICDKLIVAVLVNKTKNPTFTLEERKHFLEKALKGNDKVEICTFSGLLVDFMRIKNADVIIKGLRAVSDFEYEMQMALLNKELDQSIETLFMMSNVKYSFLSSRAVREIAMFGGNIDELVPHCIIDDIKRRFTK